MHGGGGDVARQREGDVQDFGDNGKIIAGCNGETSNVWKKFGCCISVRAVLYPVSGVLVVFSFRLLRERQGRDIDSGAY